MRIGINLSACQFRQSLFCRQIESSLQDAALAPGWLELELTESVIMEDIQNSSQVLRDLRHLGVSISLDDFGTGYSSLSYLHRFQIDTLKIDRSFVSTATLNAGSMEVVRAVAGLARNLGLDIVAEGLEQPEQVTLLRDLQCEYGQGNFFSEPVTAERILERIAIEHGAGGANITPLASA
jgi:EAL domain-containing protein (putative c-di-GMP-specific phosphodiesterase class I)